MHEYAQSTQKSLTPHTHSVYVSHSYHLQVTCWRRVSTAGQYLPLWSFFSNEKTHHSTWMHMMGLWSGKPIIN
jgi:hypothetical protein